MSIQTQTALGILRHYGYACVPYGDRKILVREGKDLVVVPNDRVDQFLKGAEMSTKTAKTASNIEQMVDSVAGQTKPATK